jgi:hypothetical protein
VEDLQPLDFETLRTDYGKTRGAVRIGGEVNRARIIFRYAFEVGLIDKPVKFGPDFKRPSRKEMRKVRASNGTRTGADVYRRCVASPTRRRHTTDLVFLTKQRRPWYRLGRFVENEQGGSVVKGIACFPWVQRRKRPACWQICWIFGLERMTAAPAVPRPVHEQHRSTEAVLGPTPQDGFAWVTVICVNRCRRQVPGPRRQSVPGCRCADRRGCWRRRRTTGPCRRRAGRYCPAPCRRA